MDLPVGVVLLIIGTVAPEGFKIVTCPWEQTATIYEPRYVDNMPKVYLGPADGFKPNPNFIEYRCIVRDGK